MKLTKAQIELLRDANTVGGTPCVQYYPPAQILVEAGLAMWGWGWYSAYGIDKLCITDAGREALRTTAENQP